jgi:type IV pilus assembly protein PilA
MIVVALVGILASIAISNFRKFVAKARQSEAKIQLGAAYTAEMGFYAEYNSFTQCLRGIGYVPSAGTRYYYVGFMAGAGNTCGRDGTGNCCARGWNPVLSCDCDCGTFDAMGANDASFGATASSTSSAVILNTCAKQSIAGLPNRWDASKEAFSIGAAGNVSDSAVYDHWEINEQKQLVNSQSGI